MPNPIKKNHSTAFIISEISLWLIALIAAFKVPGDPDMGWHLANGQYTLQHWVQRGDVFSWTMPGFPWVSHEWLTEVFMVWINSAAGLVGLSVFFAGLIALTFWLSARADQQSKLNSVLLAIVGISISYPILGVRPQMMTLLGVALLLNLLFSWRRSLNFRLLIWLPILFLAWANLHAGFSSGFLVIAVFGFSEFMRWLFTPALARKAHHIVPPRRLLQLAGMTLTGVAATLINPYGWGVYQEIWNTLTKSDILNQISEWLPINFNSLGSYNLLIAAGVVVVLLITNRFKVDYTKLTLAIVFYFIALGSWRHLALLAVVALPLLAEQLEPIVGRAADLLQRNRVGLIAAVGVVIALGWGQVYLKLPDILIPARYAASNNYPYNAVQYLKQKGITGRMFNEYNWGGYLIWQFPEQKVFIDGRMAIWETPSTKIFSEFQSLMGNYRTTTQALLNKWDIDLVMVTPGRAINGVLSLEPDTWQLIYSDSQSMVWQRKDKTSAQPS